MCTRHLPARIKDVHFAIYGLGDSSYEKFCYAGKILARRMISLGARLLTRAQKALGDGSLEDELERKLEIGGDGRQGEEEYGDEACLAWGDERAPDG